MQPRIIIADDHPVVLHGVRIVLERQQMQVVDTAVDGASLLALLRRRDPGDYDVLLTDLSMPGEGLDGVPLVHAVRRDHPALPVVVLTGVRHPEVLGGLLREGVRGLVDKAADFGELPQALRAAMAGQVHVSRGLRVHLQARDLHPQREPASLSMRECEVLDLLAQGLCVNEIATRCGRSPKTVSRQKSEAKRKLGLCNNQELFDYLRTWRR